jgi:hypothetical protein
MKSSRTSVFFRASFGVFVIYLILGKLWNFAAGQATWSVTEMAISAVVTVMFYGGIAWALTRLGMWFIHSENPEYQRYRKNSGDPFFDALPRPLNPTPDSERFRTDSTFRSEHNPFE